MDDLNDLQLSRRQHDVVDFGQKVVENCLSVYFNSISNGSLQHRFSTALDCKWLIPNSTLRFN